VVFEPVQIQVVAFERIFGLQFVGDIQCNTPVALLPQLELACFALTSSRRFRFYGISSLG
jgi:hypothetical protein